MRFLVIATLWIFTTIAWAGNEGAHGGVGVRTEGGIELLDLVELGISQTEIIPVGEESECQQLMKEISFLSPSTRNTFCAKISQIRTHDALLAESFLGAIPFYRWQEVLKPLTLVGEAQPRIKLKKKSLVQIATRTASVILISRPAFEKMSDFQRVALLIHELVYSLIPEPNGRAKSLRARDLTAFLFSTPSQLRTWRDFIGHDLPMIEDLIEYDSINPYVIPVSIARGSSKTPVPMDYSALNFAWPQRIHGESFIGFAPMTLVSLILRNDSNPDFSGETNDSIPYSTFPRVSESLKIAENPESYSRIYCAGAAENTDIYVDFKEYALALELDSKDQSIRWHKETDLKTYGVGGVKIGDIKNYQQCNDQLLGIFREVLRNPWANGP